MKSTSEANRFRWAITHLSPVTADADKLVDISRTSQFCNMLFLTLAKFGRAGLAYREKSHLLL
ncbi:hypothetical protein BTM36_19450 [Herbaspirillum sp. VT-16-41]|nr:hypothetical protein BTM36_19450 [Herbaspirillum sp. VT-16-41]